MNWTTALRQHAAEIALGAGVVLIVGAMIVPLPTWMLDVLLATNLSLAVLVLLVAFFVQHPLRFASFPTLLLVTTLFRLALNVSSTRLILLQADAGAVIEAFGTFVVQGNYVVGAVVFLVLTIVQFVVIARGAERVAEVGARFTLDAMPGKQLAIDGDLRAGGLDPETAAERRRALDRESQFYGAMDGAMKFVKGDAIASIAIVAINLVAGVAIGVWLQGRGAEESLARYGLLSIGDGLVAQIPALLLSTAAGLVVTRVASAEADGSLGRDIGRQVFGDPRALAVTAVFAGLLGIVPGLPLVPFWMLAAVFGFSAYAVRSRRDAIAAPTIAKGRGALELRVGRAIVLDEDARTAWEQSARSLYETLGLRLPELRAQPVDALAPDAYELRIAAVPVERGRLPKGRIFVRIDPATARALGDAIELDGDGGWLRDLKIPRGATVVPAGALLVDRIVAAVRARPEALLGIDDVQRELDRLAQDAPVLVRAVVPERITVARLTVLLRGLLSEGVSVRPLREILDALATDPLPERDRERLETVRQRLARQLTHGFVGPDGMLAVYALDPMIEEAVRDALDRDGHAALDPDLARDLVDAVRRTATGSPRAVLLTQPDVRGPLARVLAPELPAVAVLSYREIDPAVRVQRLGVVGP